MTFSNLPGELRGPPLMEMPARRWIQSGEAVLRLELSALGEHLAISQALRGPLFAWRCTAEAASRALRGHVVTVSLTTLLLARLAWLAL